MGKNTISNTLRALVCALFFLPIAQTFGQTVVAVPDTVFLCNGAGYEPLDSIYIAESAVTDFAVEGPVTYRISPPAGFEFQAGVGTLTVIPAGSFSFSFINVQTGFVEILYTTTGASSTSQDTIIIDGLNVTTTSPGAFGDIDRVASSGTEATHAGNGLGVNPHGVLISSPAISITPSTITDISCNGLTDGQIVVNATGGTGTLQYSNNGGSTFQGSNTFAALAAGAYDIQVMDDSGCVEIGPTDTISEPAAISIDNEAFVNVSCNGVGDGSITITASGGTAPLTYSITGGAPYQAGSSFTGLGATAYNISVQDANLCTVAGSSGNITEPTALVLNAPGETDPSCNGSGDGQVVVNASGGTPPYEYSIDNGTNYSTNNTFTGLAAGTFNLAVRDANGCITTGTSATLTDPAAINISGVVKVDLTCNGVNTGSITITASGGTPALTYSITGGAPFQAGNAFSSLAPGSYVPAVQDANGCIATASSENITEPPAISITNEVIVDVSCNGGSDGSITITATGGTAPLTYSITGAAPYQAGNSFTGLSAIAYTVSVEDANSCTATGSSGNVNEPTALVLNAPGETDPNCNGGSDGQVVVNASGGTPPYEYSIDNGSNYSSNATFMGLAAGTYNLAVRDANNCVTTGTSATLADPTIITISSVTPTNVQCNGANDGQISITASGGTGSLNYSINGGSSYQASNSFTGLSPAAYSPAVRDANGCEVFDPSVAISEPSAISISNEVITDITCNGDDDGTITITANGGTPSLEYSINNGSSYQPSSSFTGLTPGGYNIIVRDANLCTQAGSSPTINEPSVLVPGGANVTNVTSAGGSDGEIDVVGTSGGTAPYLYSLDGGTNTQSSTTFSGLTAGAYIVTVIDANGCTGTISPINVSEPGSGLQAGAIDINGGTSEEVCVGATSPAVNLNSATAASGGNTDSTLNYQWQSSPDGAAWSDIVGATSASYSVPTPYTVSTFYRREATRGDGAIPFEGPVYTNFVVLNVQALPSANINIPFDTICVESGSQLFSGFPVPMGGATGSFSSSPATGGLVDGGDGSANFDPSVSMAGLFTISYLYTDDIGCSDTAFGDILVRQNTGVTLTSSKSNYLITDPTDILVGLPAGGIYSGAGVSGNSFTPSIAGVGPHVLTYTEYDFTGCEGIANLPVTVLDTGGSQIRHLDASYCEYADTSVIRASLPAGAVYRAPFWRITGNVGITIIDDSTAIFDPTVVSMTDVNLKVSWLFSKGGNPDSAVSDVIVYTRPSVSISGLPGPFCKDVSNVVYTGFPAPPTGVWFSPTGTPLTDNGDGTATFDPSDPLVTSGSHEFSYQYTNPSTTCFNGDTISVIVNPLPVPVITNVADNYCSNALDEVLTATPVPGGGTSGVFLGSGLSDNGDGTANFVPSSLPAGNYTLSYEFTDNNGCTDRADSGITIIQKPSLAFDIPNLDYCVNDPIQTLVNISPAGGDFFGTTVVGTGPDFRPTAANIGNNPITYIYVDPGTGNCTDTLTKSFTGHQKPFVTFQNLLPDYCADVNGEFSIITDAPSSGSHNWSLFPAVGFGGISGTNIATIRIDSLTPATNYTVNYIFTESGGNSCKDSIQGNFLLEALPNVSFTMTDQSAMVVPGDPVHWCRNEDSIFLEGTPLNGIYDNLDGNNLSTGTDVSDIGGGFAYFSPLLTFGRPGSNSNRLITYTYKDPGTGCTNWQTRNNIVNDLPNPLSMSGWSTAPDGIAYFCTEDSSAIIVGSSPAGFNVDTSFIRMDKPNNPPFGGIYYPDPTRADSIIFRPQLPSDTFFVQYVYVDSLGCTDSAEQIVFINAEPRISAVLNFNTLPDGQIDSFCINEPMMYRLQVYDSAFGPTGGIVPDNETEFKDLTDSLSIVEMPSGEWFFVPQNTDSVGLHTIEYEYTSQGGCRDAEIFQVHVLDTPALSISNLLPKYCNTELNRNILLTGLSSIPGKGTFSSIGNIVVNDNGDNTADFFPDNGNWLLDQKIIFSLYDTISGYSCANTRTYTVDVHPRPDTTMILSTNSICQDDNPASIQPVFPMFGSGFNWDDSAFFYKSDRLGAFPGVDTAGQSPIGTAAIYPNQFPSIYSDTGYVDKVVFIRITTEGCIDSSKTEVVIHPRPRIDLNITNNVNDTLLEFCKNDTEAYDLDFGNIDNISPQIAPQYDGPGRVGGQYEPNRDNVGISYVSLEFTTLAGCTSFDTVYPFVYGDPEANFRVENFCLADDIQFTDLSTIDDTTYVLVTGDTTYTRHPDTLNHWEWEFTWPATGNGSNQQNPTYKYAQEGNYQAWLQIITDKGCISDTDTGYRIGKPPVADFEWDEICVNRTVQFTSTTVWDNFDSAAWYWTLAPGVTDDVENPTSSYSTPGPYTIRLIAESESGCFDTAIKTLDIRPIIDIGGSNPGYLSDYDNDIIEWRPGGLFETAFTWEQEMPAGNKINSSPPGSSNVWITNASGNHDKGEQSFVMGPCFDFSASERPMIKLQYWNETATGRNGAALEYSIDKGENWSKIGSLFTGWEWYNEDPIIGNPGDQTFDRTGWSGSTSSLAQPDWQDARHQLDVLRQRDDVLLRIAFGADTLGTSEGFAFGDVWIGERSKKVIIEHFTNSSDLNSQQGDVQHNDLVDKNIYDVYDVQFHTDFPNDDPANLDNPTDNNNRTFVYSVSSIPRTIFEGNQYSGPTFDFTNNYQAANGKNEIIEYRILEDAQFDVDVITNKTQTGVNGTVVITAREARSTTKLRIQTAVIEADIDPGSFNNSANPLPNSVFKSTMKKMIPDAIGTFNERSWNPGDQESFNFNYTYTNVYDPDTVFVVGYVQDGNTKEIYQVNSDDSTKVFDPTGLGDQWALNQSYEFILYPNPTNGQLNLRFEEILDESVRIRIYDHLGKVVRDEFLEANRYEIELDVYELPAGIYFVETGNKDSKSIKRLIKK